MNFDWTSEDNNFKEQIRALLDDRAVSERDALEHAEIAHIRRITKYFLAKLSETPYLNLCLGPPKAPDALTLLAAQEELARFSGSLFLSVESSSRLFGGLLAGFGAGDRVLEIIERLNSGKLIGAIAVSENEEQDSSGEFRTRGFRENGRIILNGRKAFVTNGPIADWIALAGEIEGSPAVFLVQPQDEGVIIGPRMQTLGYNGLAVSSLELRRASIPEEHMLGPFNDNGFLLFLRQTQDMLLTAASVGLMFRTLTEAKKYAEAHLRGGKPIFKYQEIRFKIAEMLTMSQAAQLLSVRAAWMYSESHPETPTIIHCAKAFSAESAERVASMAVQILAGAGYVSGNPVERGYRDAKYAGLAGTTTEVARMTIAEELLKHYQV